MSEFNTLLEYAAATGQDVADPLTARSYEDIKRTERRGRHAISCGGYNERPCDCGQVDRIEDTLRSLLAYVTRVGGFTTAEDQLVIQRAREALGEAAVSPERQAVIDAWLERTGQVSK